MLKEAIRRWSDWLRHAVTHPMGELNRWQRAARFTYDLSRFGLRQLIDDRATQMAAALTFRTMFSLLPVLVVATVLVKAVQGIDKFQKAASDTLTAWGLDKVEIAVPAAAASSTSTDVPGAVHVQNLEEFVSGLITDANKLNLEVIGWVGLALVMYAAISLMGTIESSFNTIYRAPTSRPWVRRIVMYYFILTVAPVMLGVTLYVNSQLNTFIDTTFVSRLHAWTWLVQVLRVIWIFCVVWLLMFLVYWQVPNTTVAWRPALTGAFVATVPLLAGGKLLGAYIGNAMAVTSLYGSLGLIPLLMYWAYLVWLTVLFGLEVAAALQNLRGRQLEELKRRKVEPGLVDPASILELMAMAVARFREGQPVTTRDMADQAGVPEEVACRMATGLAEKGFLHRVEGDNTFTLARPPEDMRADELLEVGFNLSERTAGETPAAIVDRLREVQKRLAAEMTLASLARPTV